MNSLGSSGCQLAADTDGLLKLAYTAVHGVPEMVQVLSLRYNLRTPLSHQSVRYSVQRVLSVKHGLCQASGGDISRWGEPEGLLL